MAEEAQLVYPKMARNDARRLAGINFRLGRYERAYDLQKEVVAEQEEFRDLLFLAVCCSRVGKHDEAIRYAERLVISAKIPSQRFRAELELRRAVAAERQRAAPVSTRQRISAVARKTRNIRLPRALVWVAIILAVVAFYTIKTRRENHAELVVPQKAAPITEQFQGETPVGQIVQQPSARNPAHAFTGNQAIITGEHVFLRDDRGGRIGILQHGEAVAVIDASTPYFTVRSNRLGIGRVWGAFIQQPAGGGEYVVAVIKPMTPIFLQDGKVMTVTSVRSEKMLTRRTATTATSVEVYIPEVYIGANDTLAYRKAFISRANVERFE